MDNFPYLGVDHIKDFVILNQKEFSKYANHCSSERLIYTDCISVLRSTWPVDDDLAYSTTWVIPVMASQRTISLHNRIGAIVLCSH